MSANGFGNMKFTAQGLNLLAKVQAGTTTLHFTKTAVGDGYLSDGQDETALTALINQKMILDISGLIVSGSSSATIESVLSNTGLATGFYWREMGVFATDPDLGEILYGYDNSGNFATFVPPASSSAFSAIANVGVYVANASSVTVNLVSGVAATPSMPGLVEVAASPASGFPVTPSRVASVKDTVISTATATTVVTFTPAAVGNFEVEVYLRVLAKCNITIAVTYNDGAGAQTKCIQYQPGGLFFPIGGAQSLTAGSYALPPLFINATTAAAIAVTITASVANAVYASAAILGV